MNFQKLTNNIVLHTHEKIKNPPTQALRHKFVIVDPTRRESHIDVCIWLPQDVNFTKENKLH